MPEVRVIYGFLVLNFLFARVVMASEKPSTDVEEQELVEVPIIDKNIDYSPVGKRDPFQSFIEDLKREQSASLENPLQQYELSQLKLIGLVTDISVPRAMFEDPSGKGWIIKTGANIGKHFGKVKNISKTGVTVVEEYHDRFGKLTINEVDIKMPDMTEKGK